MSNDSQDKDFPSKKNDSDLNNVDEDIFPKEGQSAPVSIQESQDGHLDKTHSLSKMNEGEEKGSGLNLNRKSESTAPMPIGDKNINLFSKPTIGPSDNNQRSQANDIQNKKSNEYEGQEQGDYSSDQYSYNQDSTNNFSIGGSVEVENELSIEPHAKVYLFAGKAESGKTQLKRAISKINWVDSTEGSEARTEPGTMKFDVFKGDRFSIDVAGEDLSAMVPEESGGENKHIKIGWDRIRMLQMISRQLKGVIFVFDLTKKDSIIDQIRLFSTLVKVIWWLDYKRKNGGIPKELPDYEYDVMSKIDKDVKKYSHLLKLDLPFFLVYSKSDILTSSPKNFFKCSSFGNSLEQNYYLSPYETNPFFFTYHIFPELYKLLNQFVDHWHADFIFSGTTDPDTGIFNSNESRGVKLGIEWLFDHCWENTTTLRSTEKWVSFQKVIDKFKGRGWRWNREKWMQRDLLTGADLKKHFPEAYNGE